MRPSRTPICSPVATIFTPLQTPPRPRSKIVAAPGVKPLNSTPLRPPCTTVSLVMTSPSVEALADEPLIGEPEYWERWFRQAGGRMTYNAVKAAEISLAKAMARDLARDNIRVNSIAPGSISFPGGSWYKRQQTDPKGIAEFITAELPFGRFGRADEVGDVVAFLASSRASWVSGTSIVVDGCQSRAF